MHDLIPRWMKFRVEKALKVRRIVNLAGVRQSGKTTLTRQLLDIEAVFRTLDNPQQLRSAPRLSSTNCKKPRFSCR